MGIVLGVDPGLNTTGYGILEIPDVFIVTIRTSDPPAGFNVRS